MQVEDMGNVVYIYGDTRKLGCVPKSGGFKCDAAWLYMDRQGRIHSLKLELTR